MPSLMALLGAGDVGVQMACVGALYEVLGRFREDTRLVEQVGHVSMWQWSCQHSVWLSWSALPTWGVVDGLMAGLRGETERRNRRGRGGSTAVCPSVCWLLAPGLAPLALAAQTPQLA